MNNTLIKEEELKQYIEELQNSEKSLYNELLDWYKKYKSQNNEYPFVDKFNHCEIMFYLVKHHPVITDDLIGLIPGIGISTKNNQGSDIIRIIKHHFAETCFEKPNFKKGKGKIYRIWFTNDPNKKSYIGQTTKEEAKSRVEEHIEDYKRKHYKCPLLHDAMKKYGVENLEFEILEEGVVYKEELDALELFYMRKYNSIYPGGLNKRYDFQHGRDTLNELDDDR